MSVLFTGSGRHFHSDKSPLYEACSCFGVESVHDLVFFSPRGPSKMHNCAKVLSSLQGRLERRLSPSTLNVHVAAIPTHHDAMDSRSLGKHSLIVRFLRSARRGGKVIGGKSWQVSRLMHHSPSPGDASAFFLRQ